MLASIVPRGRVAASDLFPESENWHIWANALEQESNLGRMLKRDVKLAHGNHPVAVKGGGWEFESPCGPSNVGPARRGTADASGGRTVQMATRKNRASKTGPRPRKMQSKAVVNFAFPSGQERLPLLIPGAYQVAMGAREEIVTWLRRVPQNTQAILILFPNEAGYRVYGPIFWHVVHQLPEIVAHMRHRRLEQLVSALMQLKLRQDQNPQRPKRKNI